MSNTQDKNIIFCCAGTDQKRTHTPSKEFNTIYRYIARQHARLGEMLKYTALLFVLFSPAVVAAPYCLQAGMDYERGCAEAADPNKLLRLRQVNDCAIVNVAAHSHWNASNLRLEVNKQYRLEVIDGEQNKWCDASVISDYLGWDIRDGGSKPGSAACPTECTQCKPNDAVAGPSVSLGLFGDMVIKGTRLLRRQPEQKLFALIGFVKGEGYEETFHISNPLQFSPRRDAEFCAYANDVWLFYGNNSGALQLKITYTGDI